MAAGPALAQDPTPPAATVPAQTPPGATLPAPPPPPATEPAQTPPPPAATAQPPAAAAQDSAAAPAEAVPARRSAQEELVVTGSRIRRKDLTTPAPVTVMTRREFENSGKLTVGDFLQTLPEQGNSPNFQLNNGGSTYGADGTTRINLRSLGITRTLVLVNGRRVVPGGLGASAAVDLNSIPSEAVERIEVLKDGASAVYGSDAVAGVVNVITRKSYNGTEVGAQYGLSQKGDAQTFDTHVTTGRSGELGSFLFSVAYFDQKESWLRDRDWSSHALTYDYSTGSAAPGGSRRTPEGVVQIPLDANGKPTADCLSNPFCKQIVTDPSVGWAPNSYLIRDPNTKLGWRKMLTADKYNFAAENYLSIPSTSVQVYSSGDANFHFARGYYETSYVQRTSQQNAAPMPLNPGDYTIGGGSTPIQVSKDSMYNPFGTALDFAGRRLVEFGHRTYSQDLGTFRIVTGLDGSLPEGFGPLHGWFWDASLNYGRTSGTFTTGGAIRNSRIADAVGPSMRDPVTGTPRCVSKAGDISTVIAGCVPINLFGGPGTIDPSQISGLGFDGTSRAFDELLSAGFNTTGELFHLAATRAVSLALGYEFRTQSGAQIADPIAASGDSADFNFTSTNGSFNVHEAYGELAVPLLSDIPGVQSLEATVAGRYVKYNTFGSNFTYKVGGRYSPVQDITFRGTASSAFRAPTISELYLGASETDPSATDPCFNLTGADPALVKQCTAPPPGTTTGVSPSGSGDGGTQELTKVGGNPKLKAETAQVFTAGIVLQPHMVRELSITVDYYAINVDNVVGTIGTAAILAGCYPGAGGQAYAPYCAQITRADNGRIRFVSDINQNVGQLKTGGIDLAIRYAIPTSLGRFGFSFDGNYLAYYDRILNLATGSVTTHGQGNYDLGALPAIKANAGVNWSQNGINAGVIARYIGTFKECGAADRTSSGGLCNGTNEADKRQVGSNVVVDLHAGYSIANPLGRTTLVAGVNNVFDKAPQYVYSSALANSDPSVYDYLGRYVYGRIQHAF